MRVSRLAWLARMFLSPKHVCSGGNSMLKRAWLYLTRKYKRSILLFFLLFVISFSIAVALSIWNSINAVTK